MLEILAIIFIINKVNSFSKSKGIDGCLFQIVTIALWFVGEIIGAIIGVIISEGEESGRCLSYIFALGGAIICSGAILLYLNNLPDKPNESDKIAISSASKNIEEPTKEWECPKCKNKNPNTSYKCNNCGFTL